MNATDYQILFNPDITTDLETGLPELPEGYFFRVEPYRALSGPNNYTYVKISIQHTYEKPREFFGVRFGTKVVTEEQKYSLVAYEDFMDGDDEFRGAILRYRAQSIFEDFEQKLRVRANETPADHFFGDYPPKRLEN